jgi:hypothetical protein
MQDKQTPGHREEGVNKRRKDKQTRHHEAQDDGK